MNATLLETHPQDIYHMEPSPDVDAAWYKISDMKPIAIKRQAVVALGKDASKAAKWPESLSFGPDLYIGRLDVFHQIHCLDALRREVHFDYYYCKKFPGGYQSSDALHKTHLSHCISLLLQNGMCSASVDVYTHLWTDTHAAAQPDFNIYH